MNHRYLAVYKTAHAALTEDPAETVRLAGEVEGHLDTMILDAVRTAVEKLRPEPAMRSDLWWDGYDEALTDLTETVAAQVAAYRKSMMR